ncbi:MAG: stage V sporulation protein R [Deltaproteobacteria bacterium]|mgnify:CR=1 FL=1|jgi:stage V sporulation protein R|nr:MAG: stage V sporulation protein R [Deltaproteobacteria bacterium]
MIPSEIQRYIEEIKKHALDYGLDFFEVVFEVVDFEEMNMLASYGGFPIRYPHWRFGMEYEKISKSYSYGLHKIYEMVINNDPAYAYLLKGNTDIDQKLVIAHVYGHVDFFKNNLWFSKTNRKMLDEMANHAVRVRRYIDRYGPEEVENFIDVCLSIEDLIDIHSPFIKRRHERKGLLEREDEGERKAISKLRSPNEYLDEYINPEDFIEWQKKKAEEERIRRKRFPEYPERDVLLFLIENAPVEEWQRDILSMIREESYYYAPQIQTKIMNEGWAAYWHSKILTEKVVTDREIIDYADHHSGTLATRPGVINPYKLGMELFKDIEDRWNKGKFGREYEECNDIEEKRNWDRKLGLGREKIFEVRKFYNDVTFIDEFLTEDFCREHGLFTYTYNRATGMYEIESRDFKKVKEKLLFLLTNCGRPIIEVVDGNYMNRGELYLIHRHEGVDLKIDWAKDVLNNLSKIWKRPVYLETVVEGKVRVFSADAGAHRK